MCITHSCNREASVQDETSSAGASENDHFILEELNAYLTFLGSNTTIKVFLKLDKKHTLADKYLLALVFIYLTRAGLRPGEYTAYHFFIALYLAHDMEEDNARLKVKILLWVWGSMPRNMFRTFFKRKNDFWTEMNYRAYVCESEWEQGLQVPLSQSRQRLHH